MGRSVLATAGQMIAAMAVAVVVSVVALIAISRVEWPAFPSSNQLHALTTVGQVGCLVLLLGTGFAVAARGYRWAARIAAAVFLSAFTVVTLGMPLGATKLYLFGISVDQQFRTEYLTRLTDSPALHDMTYAGMPPFYPPGWFWIGGRAAALTGTPAWEMFKPWAITSIAIAVVLAMVLWSALIRFEYALIVTTATAAVTLAYSSPEPYAAMITVLIPPVLVLAWSGLRGRTAARRLGGRRRRRRLPRRRRHLLHPAAGLHRVHRRGDGRAGGDRAPQCRTAAAAGGHRRPRRGRSGRSPGCRSCCAPPARR